MLREDNAMPLQRTAAGLEYEALVKSIKSVAHRGDEAEIAEFAERNASILELKDLRPGDVHQDEILTSLSVQYVNDDYIGLRIMPQVLTGGSLSGLYFEYNQRDRLNYPDDTASDRATGNELGQGRSKKTYSLTTRSLREYLDWMTLQNQSAPLNELIDVQSHVLDGIAFNREKRIITTATTSGNFGSNTVALAGSDRWDTSAGGDPAGVADTAIASLWQGMGPTKLVAAASLNVYNVLKRHPRILDTFKYGVGSEGPKFANTKMLAEYFEVDEFLVGRARKDNANENATASFGRMWPDVLGFYRVSTAPSLRNVCFGYSIQDMATQSDLMWNQERGPKGAYVARSSMSDQQKVISLFGGYLVTTPIG
jgi:hypothetical protein